MSAITDTAARMVSADQMSFSGYDTVRLTACQAHREHNDELLLRMLRYYCPNDPHLQSYPQP